MWNWFVEFLKAWKARFIAFAMMIAGFIDVIEPDWLVNIFGAENKGYVYIAVVGGGFILNQIISSLTDTTEEKA